MTDAVSHFSMTPSPLETILSTLKVWKTGIPHDNIDGKQEWLNNSAYYHILLNVLHVKINNLVKWPSFL